MVRLPADREKVLEAVKRAKELAGKRNFTQSVELMVSFRDLDLNRVENRIVADVRLPHGTGKSQKVAVFAEGELAANARDAGADLVLGRKEIEELGGDRKRAKKLVDQYAFFLAQVDMMPFVGRQLGPILGPRGKMPKPVPPTADIKSLIESCRAMIRINVRTQPVAHVLVGRERMSEEELADNVEAVISTLESRLPKGLKQIKSAYVKTTMGKPVRIEV